MEGENMNARDDTAYWHLLKIVLELQGQNENNKNHKRRAGSTRILSILAEPRSARLHVDGNWKGLQGVFFFQLLILFSTKDCISLS